MSEYLQHIERHPIVDRAQWLNGPRRLDITASRIGALFGEHPYATALRLYVEKRGVEFAEPDNKVLRRGRWMEPAVREAVAELHPEWDIQPAKVYLRDPALRLGATPDYFIFGDPRGLGVLQAKSVDPKVFARDWNEGTEPPFWIVLQALTEMMLSDAKFGVAAGLVVDSFNMDVHICEVPRNAVAEAKIITAVEKFWHDVEHGIEPDANYGKDTDAIRAMTAKATAGKVCDLSGDNELPELLELRGALMRTIDTNKSRCEEIENQIRLRLRDAEMAEGLPGWRITYKTQDRAGYTVKPKSMRVLRIMDKREAAP